MIRKITISVLFSLVSIKSFAFDGNGFIDSYTGIEFKKLNYRTYLAVYEVTQEQWDRVMGTAPFTFNNGGKYPAETISIGDIQKFLDKLNEVTKSEYRLPTVAEWKEAVGEVLTNPDEICGYANLYDISSNKLNRFGNAYFECDDKYPNTAPVGSFTPNKKGFYDLFGNVKEWCCNSENDKTNSCANLLGAASLAVVGGGFSDGPKEMRKYIKDERTSLRFAGLGFRLAISKDKINDNALFDPKKPKVINPASTTPINQDENTHNSQQTVIKNYENNVTNNPVNNTQVSKPKQPNNQQNNNPIGNSNTTTTNKKEENRKFKFLPFLRD